MESGALGFERPTLHLSKTWVDVLVELGPGLLPSVRSSYPQARSHGFLH